MNTDAKGAKNKQVKISRPKHKLRGMVNGESFTLHVRKYRDKHGRIVRVIAGPGLRDVSLDST